MKIRDFLLENFRKRLKNNPCLVIYDPPGLYRSVAQLLAGPLCRVVEVAETVIEPRERAMQGLQDLAAGTIDQLVIWLATRQPQDLEGRQKDLFSVFGLVGTSFPTGDGDTLLALCRRALPNHTADITRLFQHGVPTLEMIDALDGSSLYPQLSTLLGTTSTKEILLRLMVPMAQFEAKLKEHTGWVEEAHKLILSVLHHKLITKGVSRDSISQELWRLVLFSEFAFDSPEKLPAQLSQIPRAQPGDQDLVFDLCNDLRNHKDYLPQYLKMAGKVEKDLNLAQVCQGMCQLGQRDTFAFEELALFRQAVALVKAGDVKAAVPLADDRKGSIWRHQNDVAEMRWSILEKVVDLLKEAEQLPRNIDGNLTGLVYVYANEWRKLDRCHRELEQVVAKGLIAEEPGLDEVILLARKTYRAFIDPIQASLIKRVKEEGWPPALGSPYRRNSQLFDQVVQPLLKAEERVAYILVDSLRYELGVELAKQLQIEHVVTLHTVWAQLPTYTEVGMASLMPEAHTQLRLVNKDGTLVTTLGGQPATNPKARMAYLVTKMGDMCADMDLSILTGGVKKPKLSDKVRLLVVRNYELDSAAHASTAGLLSFLPDLLRKVQRGIFRLREMGFQKAVIATDHGFLIFPEMGSGNLAYRPQGNWLVTKTRCNLGEGKEDAVNAVFAVSQVGLSADCKNYAVPRTLAPYEKGESYFHEGLSLQEAILPCLVVELKDLAAKKMEKLKLSITYRQGRVAAINTMMPSLELKNLTPGNLFPSDPAEMAGVEVTVEAVDKDGKVVGEVASGSTVNMANHCVRVEPGQTVTFSIRMERDFEGSFKIRVSDPNTQLVLAELPLKTDYMR